jgi:hypothetical protein
MNGGDRGTGNASARPAAYGREHRRCFSEDGWLLAASAYIDLIRCRRYHSLEYASRNMSPAQRAMHRADTIANRLHDMWKGTTKGKREFPPKPSRMRWRTYLRLKQQYDELRRRWLAGVMGRFG